VLPINNDFNIYARLKGKENRIVSLNSKLKKLADIQKITFINLFPLYEDNDGKLQKEITADGLHLLPEAYGKWVEKIRTIVTDNKKGTF
jgi:lysophospholipase L1-like esterase